MLTDLSENLPRFRRPMAESRNAQRANDLEKLPSLPGVPTLEEINQTEPARNLVTAIRFDYVDRRQSSQPTEEVVHQLLQTNAPEIALDLVAPENTFDSVEAFADMLDDTCLPLSQLREKYAAIPATPQEFRERLALILAIGERAASLLDLLLDEQADLQLSVDAAAKRLIRAHRKAVNPPLLPPKSRERRLAELGQCIDDYRERASVYAEVEAEVELLQAATGDCIQLVEQDFNRISIALQFLKRQLIYGADAKN